MSTNTPNPANPSSTPTIRILGLQTGTVQDFPLPNGKPDRSAFRKTPRLGRIPVGKLGLQGDEQADLSVHGGPDKALYAYPHEHYPHWQTLRREAGLDDAPLACGALGENLTLVGLLETEVWVGDRLHFPDCILRVTAPREPCYKLNAALGLRTADKHMMQTAHCGFYLAVDTPGTLAVGDTATLEPGSRSLRIDAALRAKLAKHRNEAP